MSFREILDLFRSGKTTAKSHIKNLIEIASADGRYAKEEDELLIAIAARNGISRKRIEEIRSNPQPTAFELPKQERERFEQLFDLVHMMIVDKEIHPEEARLCELFASRFEYPKPAIKGIIDTIRHNIGNGNDAAKTHERVVYFIKFNQMV